MTEDEAKAKQCPFSFGVPEIRGSDGSGIRCCTVHCMAWQWDDGQQNSYAKDRPPGDDWEKVGNFWTRTPKPGQSWRPGYCGMVR